MILTTWLGASIPVGTRVDENATLIVQVGVEDESLALLILFGGVGRTCCAEPEVVTSTTRMLGVIESYSHGHGFKGVLIAARLHRYPIGSANGGPIRGAAHWKCPTRTVGRIPAGT